ncbi:MAG: Fic family protein [Terriglobia bacterium]
MKSLHARYLAQLSFQPEDLSTLAQIGAFMGKQELYAQQAPEMLEALRQNAIIESNESSNRIEQIKAPRKRIKDLVEHHIQPKTRSEQEIAGYRDALELVHESAEHMSFSQGVILQLHRLVYRYHPGEGGRWKTTDNNIVERNPDGTIHRIRFQTVRMIETPQAMENLVTAYQRAAYQEALEPLVAVPLAILDFLCIHPFRDGNGRVGRLLTLLLLYHFDYWVGRYISLERVIEESKETYYETLEASSQGWHQGTHDVHPWLRYFWGMLLRAYREFEERAGQLERGTKTEMIRKAVDRRLVPFAISDITAELPTVSRDMIRFVLRKLRNEGIIESTGKGRAAKWRKLH